MSTLLADPVAQVIATAEELLTRRAGATVTLAEPEDLGGSGPAIVLRVRTVQNPFSLPKTMVIKQVPEDGSELAMLREVVSYQFANSLTARYRPGPELIGHDLARRLIVLTDLGSAPTMSELLAERDHGSVSQALMAWAQALGRMHVATVGREGDFAALLRRIDVKNIRVDISQQRLGAGDVVAAFADVLKNETNVSVPRALMERIQQTADLFVKGGVRAFSPSEVAPDNIMVTEHGVRILDYEWGGFRDIVFDMAHALTGYPEFLNSTHRSAVAELDDEMTEAWRSEVVAIAPALVDDGTLARRICDARLLWVWLTTHERGLSDRTVWPLWTALHAAADRAGDDQLMDHASELIAALRAS